MRTVGSDVDLELVEMLKAAALGQPEWGTCGSSREHRRYAMPSTRMRRRCSCGCGSRCTHVGCANGVALMSGCELTVRRWVRDPSTPRVVPAALGGGEQ